ncbi:hypothetical protein LEP1GSC050_0054 [Leptospira phage vB_LbrZ_5399-LE1]|uniref:Uncharacterized protein n=1 Tax=Leptospira inadai serovar Lyme TaxID=293084 RepID=A0ABX4YGC6_9LEPT|nr:hypothetical protein [Leptospira inadai]AGS80768.1 hypothetical protein LEP1GSC050_0054 [Leptospira phage vB_LbrZ_5399-LE1]AGS80838.1 hypothetical protein LEP1GSC047_0915 [Leptospira phage vB_LinZ_10-LE1]PNV74317.1 hypothetical protein BES34_014115 [Leptospira inadai serovar Lyme]
MATNLKADFRAIESLVKFESYLQYFYFGYFLDEIVPDYWDSEKSNGTISDPFYEYKKEKMTSIYNSRSEALSGLLEITQNNFSDKVTELHRELEKQILKEKKSLEKFARD